MHPTREFPPVVGTGRSLGRWGNRAAGRLTLHMVDRIYAPIVRELRAELGLRPVARGVMRKRQESIGWPVLYGYSPSVVPRPDEGRGGLEVVGNWWPDDPAHPELPDGLADFLQVGAERAG